MPVFDECCVLIPVSTLEDFPSDLSDYDARSLLAAWTVLWNPHLLAQTEQIPTWYRADSPPERWVSVCSPPNQPDRASRWIPDSCRTIGRRLLGHRRQPRSDACQAGFAVMSGVNRWFAYGHGTGFLCSCLCIAASSGHDEAAAIHEQS